MCPVVFALENIFSRMFSVPWKGCHGGRIPVPVLRTSARFLARVTATGRWPPGLTLVLCSARGASPLREVAGRTVGMFALDLEGYVGVCSPGGEMGSGNSCPRKPNVRSKDSECVRRGPRKSRSVRPGYPGRRQGGAGAAGPLVAPRVSLCWAGDSSWGSESARTEVWTFNPSPTKSHPSTPEPHRPSR